MRLAPFPLSFTCMPGPPSSRPRPSSPSRNAAPTPSNPEGQHRSRSRRSCAPYRRPRSCSAAMPRPSNFATTHPKKNARHMIDRPKVRRFPTPNSTSPATRATEAKRTQDRPRTEAHIPLRSPPCLLHRFAAQPRRQTKPRASSPPHIPAVCSNQHHRFPVGITNLGRPAMKNASSTPAFPAKDSRSRPHERKGNMVPAPQSRLTQADTHASATLDSRSPAAPTDHRALSSSCSEGMATSYAAARRIEGRRHTPSLLHSLPSANATAPIATRHPGPHSRRGRRPSRSPNWLPQNHAISSTPSSSSTPTPVEALPSGRPNIDIEAAKAHTPIFQLTVHPPRRPQFSAVPATPSTISPARDAALSKHPSPWTCPPSPAPLRAPRTLKRARPRPYERRPSATHPTRSRRAPLPRPALQLHSPHHLLRHRLEAGPRQQRLPPTQPSQRQLRILPGPRPKKCASISSRSSPTPRSTVRYVSARAKSTIARPT